MGAPIREARWAKYQPQDGEIVLTCAHVNRLGGCSHWFMLDRQPDGSPGLMPTTRPDGTVIQSRWLCCCESCMMADIETCVAGDIVWSGNDPIIRESVN
jgi:hypothetical protein